MPFKRVKRKLSRRSVEAPHLARTGNQIGKPRGIGLVDEEADVGSVFLEQVPMSGNEIVWLDVQGKADCLVDILMQ